MCPRSTRSRTYFTPAFRKPAGGRREAAGPPPARPPSLLGGAVVGYGIAHPWTLRDVPKLDHVLGALPPTPDCVFIHDVAILPAARGHRASAAFVERMRDIARGLDIRALALVSVYDTRPVWSRYGFRAVDDAALAPALAPYGADARYMVADIR
ncbi:MAG: GNAT family N-acetyltransferase [Rhodospirillales bacterium]|nr:MAG: GNAT family N-acetyltransferase [Rhodospirillales bacterium]